MTDLKCPEEEGRAGETRRMDGPGGRIAVVGGRGMLGLDLLASLERAGFDPVCLDLAEIDITDVKSVRSCFEDLAPGLAINCAAYTAVDRAESEPDLAFRVNRDGPANLAGVCDARRIPLIQISTDYVFDGRSQRAYAEDDPPNPLGVYGSSKWEGEEAVRQRLAEHSIVRTAWLYGVHGQNFVKTILRLASEREEMSVVADQYGCPTWTVDLAGALTAMAKRIFEDGPAIPWGTCHYCGAGQTTWHEFAEAIVSEGRQRQLLKVKRIKRITTAEYPTAAPRPAWSVLDCARIESTFGIVRPQWRTSLSRMIAELNSNGVSIKAAALV